MEERKPDQSGASFTLLNLIPWEIKNILKILCSGYLIRYPVGGHTWHHLQYLIGFQRLGHEVIFFEDYGWPNSCYDPVRGEMTGDPRYGISYLLDLLRQYGLENSWCFLAEDGTAYGMSRRRLAQLCEECDVYVNLSNINWIPELEQCQRRVLVDTDPVFTQIGAHGLGGPFSNYNKLFTYGENVHQPGCDMPTGGAFWLPTRQPVVLDLWPVVAANRFAPFTTVMKWSSFRDLEHDGRIYGGKDREFAVYFTLPRDIGEVMEITLSASPVVQQNLLDAGWQLANPQEVTRDPWSYQSYLQSSRAEFSVAKHGYVTTRCGWFSDRSTAYLASGRPVVVQETGFSNWLETGVGIVPFHTYRDAISGIESINSRYEEHCLAARSIAEEYFDARKVLGHLIDRAMNDSPPPANNLSRGPSEESEKFV